MDGEGLGLNDFPCGSIAAGSLLKYLYETQKNSLAHMSMIHSYTTGKFMLIDSSTRRNLELVETLREKSKKGSLLWRSLSTSVTKKSPVLTSATPTPYLSAK